MKIIIIISFLLISTISYASVIPAPNQSEDGKIQRQYLKTLYDTVSTMAQYSTDASTGAGTVKMGSGNPATNNGWIALKVASGSTVYIPYWKTQTP